MNLERDIEAGLKFLNYGYNYNGLKRNIQDEFDYFCYGIPFSRTNEDLGAYYKYFPINNKKVLTVVGSGDQILQAVKDNPREIHAFDMNPLAIYMSKLKIAGVQSLDCSEYSISFNYFCEYSLSLYYKRIREYLDKEACLFWDSIYNSVQKQGLKIQTRTSSSNRGKDSYEYIENYYLTKDNISKVKIYYYVSKLFELENIIKNEKFDTIILSNIYDWLTKKDQIEFCKYIKQELNNYLQDNGIIDVYSSISGTCDAENPDELKEFTNTIHADDDYAILVYKKIK